MIARVDIRLNVLNVIYDYIECDYLDEVKAKYKKRADIEYIGEILQPKQIKMLQTHGNTVINETMINKLSQEKILAEVKRITGYDCNITQMPSGTIVLSRY